MAFNIVQTQQEADNFTYKENQSTVLYTINTKGINIHGCNVVTKTPIVGDVLCITQRYEQNSDNNGWTLLPPESQDIVWVKGDTINMNVWPIETIGGIGRRAMEPVGICYKVRNRKAYVVYAYPKDLASYGNGTSGLSKSYRFKVGITNVPSSDVEVTISGLTSGNISVTVTGATNLLDFCRNVQLALAELEGVFGSYATCQYIGPHEYDPLDEDGFYEGDDGIMVLNINPQYADNDETSMYVGEDAVSLTPWSGQDVCLNVLKIPNSWYCYKNNGTLFYLDEGYINSANNLDAFCDYVKDNGRNLTRPVTNPLDERDVLPVNEDAFNSNYGKVYKDAYGSYKKYVESCMTKLYGGLLGVTINRGHMYTQMLAKAKYTFTIVGHTVIDYLYPAAYVANEKVSVNCLGLEAGNWWVPSVGELAELFNGNNVDTINNVAGKLGFPALIHNETGYKYISCTPIIGNRSYEETWRIKSYYFEFSNGYFHAVPDNMNFARYDDNPTPILLPITAVDI